MKRMLIILISIIILIIVVLIYFAFNGNPITKFIVKKEANNYLINKYINEFTIKNVNYSLDDGHYYAVVSDNDDPKISFKVSRYKNKKSGIFEYVDNYFITYWENQVGNELTAFVRKIFSQEDLGIIIINENPIYNDYLKNVSEIPSYNEVRDKIKSNIDIYININREFMYDKTDEEYDNLLEVLNFIKQNNYKPDYIRIYFEDDSSKEKGTVVYKLTYSDLLKLESKNDIVKFKK